MPSAGDNPKWETPIKYAVGPKAEARKWRWPPGGQGLTIPVRSAMRPDPTILFPSLPDSGRLELDAEGDPNPNDRGMKANGCRLNRFETRQCPNAVASPDPQGLCQNGWRLSHAGPYCQPKHQN